MVTRRYFPSPHSLHPLLKFSYRSQTSNALLNISILSPILSTIIPTFQKFSSPSCSSLLSCTATDRLSLGDITRRSFPAFYQHGVAICSGHIVLNHFSDP